MGMLVLASAAGAPGVTTTALGLTLAWPRPALLADVDRDPSQAVLAGYLGGVDPQRRGLVGLAQAHREGRPLDVLAECLPLPPAHQQAFLPGFANPGQVELFTPVWPALAHALSGLAAGARDVVVDAGRLGAAGLPLPLVRSADVVAVVTGSSLRSLAAIRGHLPALVEAAGEHGAAVGLVIVGEGRPYTAREASAQFGLPVLANLPWDPAHAATLSDGAPRAKRGGRLGKALEPAAADLAQLVERRRNEVRGAA